MLSTFDRGGLVSSLLHRAAQACVLTVRRRGCWLPAIVHHHPHNMERILSLCVFLSLLLSTLSLNVDLKIESDIVAAQTDTVVACFTLDYWPPSKCDYGACQWGLNSLFNINLENENLRAAVAAFKGKVHLRLGGSLEDFVLYDVPGSPRPESCIKFEDFGTPTNATKLGYEIFSGCLNSERWDQLHTFCADLGCKLIFGINGLFGRNLPGPCSPDVNCRVLPTPACCTNWSGAWNPSNAEALLRYSASKNQTLYAVELGNELVGSKGIESHVSVDDYLADWKVFMRLLDDVYGSNRPLTVVPDTSWESDWYADFLVRLHAANPELSPDVVTHHLYSMGAGVNPLAWQAALNATIMDEVLSLGKQVRSVVKAASPRSRVWVGEAGGFYNSGADNVTNAFNSGFWFLDQLGVFALTGHGSYCRQTLAGGFYSLLDSLTLKPNPDYYNLLAFSQLMGSKVLQVTRAQESIESSSVLRAYAHCMHPDAHSFQNGGVTVLLINLHNATSVHVASMDDGTQKNMLALDLREEYVFTSACKDADERQLLACRHLLLNGKLLESPTISPVIVHGGLKSPLIVGPLSYSFVAFPQAQATACM